MQQIPLKLRVILAPQLLLLELLELLDQLLSSRVGDIQQLLVAEDETGAVPVPIGSLHGTWTSMHARQSMSAIVQGTLRSTQITTRRQWQNFRVFGKLRMVLEQCR